MCDSIGIKLDSVSQPKQRTSLSSSLDVQRPVNHSCEPSEVSSSLGYASFSTSPPASPPLSPNQEDSAGSNDDCQLTGKLQLSTTTSDPLQRRIGHINLCGFLQMSSIYHVYIKLVTERRGHVIPVLALRLHKAPICFESSRWPRRHHFLDFLTERFLAARFIPVLQRPTRSASENNEP